MTEATTGTTLTLATLRAGQRLRGLVPGQTVTLIAIDPIDAELFEVFYRDDSGRSGARAITDADAARFEVAGDFDSAPAYDADPDEFRLAAEALRIKYAALYDPMVAVNSSDVDPLPHQIRAVYEELLKADNTDYEAHWGSVLCKFGIEYVDDPISGERKPTCHRTIADSIFADPAYRAALEYAPLDVREVYEREAAQIDRIELAQAQVDHLDAELVGHLLDHLRLAHAGRAVQHDGLLGLDQVFEGLGHLRRTHFMGSVRFFAR